MSRKRNTASGVFMVAAAVATLCVPLGTRAGGIYTYPLAGQSAEQQGKDAASCRQWATAQTGFNPAQPPPRVPPSYSPPPPSGVSTGIFGRGQYGEGGGVLDAGKGAAGGAIFGAIAGDAGAGAAIGALSGLFLGAVRRSDADSERAAWERQQAAQQQQQQAAANAQYARGQQNYDEAFKTCMRARKYEVS